MEKRIDKSHFLQHGKNWLPNNVSILGAARSGIAVAKFLLNKDIKPFLSDTCSAEKLEKILKSNGLENINYEFGGHSEKVLDAELVICSPGIPSDIPILKEAKKLGIPVWSEVELAFRQSEATFLAVTGSTGKSTTVSLMGSIFTCAKVENVVAGNIGLPLIGVAPKIKPDGFVIAEISSFQLENINMFKPKVAAILNLMKNHLDRYKNEEEYYNAKKSIITAMDESDTIVINANDDALVTWVDNLNRKLKVVYFGKKMENSDCVWYEGTDLISQFGDKKESILDLDSMYIKGKHNFDNACAAAAIAISSGIDKKSIIEGVINFKGLAHRLEFIREVNGIKYYNDSKATTAESVECAVNAFKSDVHLIAGGKDKGCDFSLIRNSIKNNVKSVCLIGEASQRISQAWEGITSITSVDTLDKALGVINNKAKKNDVVVLSPGCSSFDMFSSYEERGNIFKKLVHAII